ncbi:substrate-binding periplasmic protein [Janthinobacterium fluminis]|uniref:ABC transporter substrate-binding protein n=1 Tax=Janthinobacterium fluminis TaxID=2987524 RepID=A0ABT5K9L8_9BURK|nr:ABC transporter substrate-binding protein [Janthinobacterium fluminis]MDC8760512.1 ABC transporter substrate-binding protein [Janthinobacterium fluminis]
MKNSLSGIALACACLFAGASRADTVIVYTSANFAPLMIDGERGIYPDLIGYLNRKKIADYTFKLVYLPRKRLQVKLEDGSLNGIVIGMMPQWLNDTGQSKYLWTTAFAHDRFVLVSTAARPLNPQEPATLAGATIGLTLGYVYPGIDEWIRRHGLIRHDALSEEKNLDKLLRNRVDCSAVVESMVRYYIKKNNLYGQFKIAAMPGPGTDRRFLAPRAQQAVFDKLVPVINKLKDDPEWKRALAQYE